MIARLKMAPLLVGLAAFISAICIAGTFIYSVIQQTRAHSIDFNVGLYNYAVDVADHIQINPTLDMAIPIESYLDKDRIYPFQHGDSLVEIVNRGGTRLFHYSLNKAAPETPLPKLDSFSKNSDELYFDFNQNDRDWRTLILPVDDEEPPLLFLAVTVPKDFLTSQIQESVTIFTGTGVTGLLTLIFTLTLAVYWATRSLRSLTHQIENISIGQAIAEKIEIPTGPFEVVKLGETFNSLLDRVSNLVTSEKEFTANAAHQLKTPLTIARGHIELLLREPRENPTEILETSLEEIDNLAQIIENLLLLARIEGGLDQPRIVPVRIDELLTEIAADAHPVARKSNRRIRLQIDTGESEALTIQTDPHFLREALRNLVENALRYANDEVVTVTLSSSQSSFSIAVKNTYGGPTIDFDPTQRFLTGSHPNSGHGLGLSISRKLLKLLGFSISFKTEAPHFLAVVEIKKN